MERHSDVCVVGGSAAGLAAALQLVRQGRSVMVVDSGEPRNAPAAHMHSYLGYDGRSPSELVEAGREEVRRYGGEVVPGRVLQVDGDVERGFRLELTGGHTVRARRVIAATGLVDELPEIEGLAEHWGRDVIHCPFCHGYEVRDGRIVFILTHPMGLHPATLFRQLTSQLSVVVHDGTGVDETQLDALAASGVAVHRQPAARIHGDGRLTAVELADGERLAADTVAVTPRFHARTEPFARIGLETVAHPTGMGDVVATDLMGATAVPGLFAAGNVTDPTAQVLHAAAVGSRVGAAVASSLAHEELAPADQAAGPQTPARSANESDWDHRYSGEAMWSGNPNGSLVAEATAVASGAAPGRALDVGAGEGGDAVWLAEQGWQVTASDISSRGLERVAAHAAQRGLDISCLHADANDPAPYPHAAFDLVTAHYASIPRTPDRRGARNLLDAVAPGGALLVVSHDLEPMRGPIDTREESRAFDPDAYLRVEDIAAMLAEEPGWTIEVHEKRPRDAGHHPASPHVDDIILRARRQA